MIQQEPTSKAKPPKRSNNRWKKFGYPLIAATTGILIISAGSSIYLVNTLNRRLPLIQKMVYIHTGYQIALDYMDSGFNTSGQPYLTINGLKIMAPEQVKPFMQIRNIQLVLSYSSFWHLVPVFSSMQISGSDFLLNYDKSDNLILNDRIITNLKKPSSPSKFDFEHWLWLQKNIIIDNINLSLLDSKHHMLPLNVGNIFINIHNAEQHIAYTKFNLGNGKIEAGINFSGNTLKSLKDVRNGDLQLNSIGENGYLLNLTAQVNNGSLQFIHANLNSNNQQIDQIIDSYQAIRSFSGTVQLDQKINDPDSYIISAHNLTLNTVYGYLFNRAEISGELNNHSNGDSYLNINNIRLDGANSLLKLTQFSNSLSFSGVLNTINIHWKDNIFKPRKLQLNTSFNDLSLNSQDANIPSFNHLNGQLMVAESNGMLNLQMNDGKIIYPKFFYQPLIIQHFNTNLNWQTSASLQKSVTWDNTLLRMPQLELTTAGNYNLDNSQVKLKGKVNHVDLASIYQILPKTIPNAGVKYIKDSLKSGYFRDIIFNMTGDLRAFPFENGGGEFNLAGALENVNYQFTPEFGSLDSVQGKIAIHNQFNQLTLNSGKLKNILLNNAKITLADSNAQAYTINVEANTNGQTSDFISYLESSPFHAQIEKVQRLVDVNGHAKTSIKISVPLNKPATFKLIGYYQPESNQIIVKALPSLLINDVSGKFGFNQKGIDKTSINAKILNSQLSLNAPNPNTLVITSPNFNFSNLIKFIYPPLESAIYGTAPLEISYSLQQQQLSINSNLESVNIDTPEPLRKMGNNPSSLQILSSFTESSPEINVNYANKLYARLNFAPQRESGQIQIAIGEDNFSLHHPISSAPVTIKASLDNFHVLEWGKFISGILSSDTSVAVESSLSSRNESGLTYPGKVESTPEFATLAESAESRNLSKFLPIQVELNANAFWLDNYNLDGGIADIIVNTNKIHAQVNTPDLQGIADFYPESNNLNVNLNSLIYSSANFLSQPKENIESKNLLVTPQLESNSLIHESMPATINYESGIAAVLTESSSTVESQPSTTKPGNNSPLPKLPMTTFNVDNLYYEGHYLGSLTGKLYPADSSLYLENLILKNQSATTRINLLDYCTNCNDGSSYTILNVHSDVNDLGSLVNKMQLGNMFHNGNGTVDLNFKWPGNLWNFNQESTLGAIDINIANGDLTHVNPGLVGALIGVINLSAINNITNLNHFNFNNLFGQGFAYKKLHTTAKLKNNTLTVEELTLDGEVATVNSFGDFYLASNKIDSYVTVEPRLGGTIATTAGIVTLNPFIGVFVYLGEKLFGEPINKALAVSYHITGDVESPTFTQTKISSQLLQNFRSSMDFLPLPALPANTNNDNQ